MTESAPRKSGSLERTGRGTYRATNTAGAVLDFGRGEGLLSPVDLLLAAIGGCAAIDVDFVTAKRSEPDSFVVDISAQPVTDPNGGHRIDDVVADFQLRFPQTDEGRAAADVVARTLGQSLDRLCTVSRTVAAATTVTFREDGKNIS